MDSRPHTHTQTTKNSTAHAQRKLHAFSFKLITRSLYYIGLRLIVSLYKRKRPIVIEHFLQLSVGLCVCLSIQCIVADRVWMRFGMVGWMGSWIRYMI